jgi:hypothetical protein
MASAAQIAANQANAQKSTGPRTPPGKAMASRNSLKHGLAGRGIVLPEAEEKAVAERFIDWRRSYAVRAPHEEFALREMVRESVRIERCNLEDVALRGRMVDRAVDSWDDDRRIAAEELGRAIHRDPSLVSRKLQMTPQGCDWLIVRWEGLALVVESGREWADEHRALASDLLGVPPELRDGPSPLDLTEKDAAPEAVQAHRLGAIRGEIDRLKARRDGIVGKLDADDRALVSGGVEVEPDRALGRLRRYAAGCRRRFDAAAKVLKDAARRVAESRARRLGTAPEPKCPTGPAAEAMLADLFVRSARAQGERRKAAEAAAALEPTAPPAPAAPPRPMNRQQRRALARRRPELALA